MNDVLATLRLIVGFLKAHTMSGGDIGSINYWLIVIISLSIAIKAASMGNK